MNRRQRQPVEDRTRERCSSIFRRFTTGSTLLALCLCAAQSWIATGCVEVDGGAVEFSWALRNFEGNSISCAAAEIDTVSLCWRDTELPGDNNCTPEASRDFVCDREEGATAFEVPPGTQTLWIEVSCATSGTRAVPEGYDVPAPFVRTVTNGDIVTLNSLLIVASDQQVGCGARPCTCPP